MRIQDLDTPAFLVDRTILEGNIRRMRAKAADCGVRLRPHVKTHKSVEIALLESGGAFGPITVSTLAEARFFSRAGFADITWAVPVAPKKLAAAAKIAREARRLHILVDCIETARAAAAVGRENKVRFSVFLKVDCGYHRAGVDPEKKESVELARFLHNDESLEFRGILTHAGHAYGYRTPEAIKVTARQECNLMERFARRLEQEGIPCKEISVGSTPTAVLAEGFPGATEIRPGNFVFFDRFQAEMGVCSIEDCAATVAATVIGRYAERNRLLVDAGALALSKDPGATHLRKKTAFGAVLGRPELEVTHLSQEHGLIGSAAPIPFAEYPIGRVIRIVPNHSCLAAALFPEYHVVEGGEVVDRWVPVRGW